MSVGGSYNWCWCISFFAFFRSELSPRGNWNICFMAALCLLIVTRPNLEVAININQKGSQLAGKNIGVVLVLWCAWKCVFTAISSSVDIPKFHGCHLLKQQHMSSYRGSQSYKAHSVHLPPPFSARGGGGGV